MFFFSSVDWGSLFRFLIFYSSSPEPSFFRRYRSPSSRVSQPSSLFAAMVERYREILRATGEITAKDAKRARFSYTADGKLVVARGPSLSPVGRKCGSVQFVVELREKNGKNVC